MRIALSIFSGIIINFVVIFGFELLAHSFISIPSLAPNAKPDYSSAEFTGILVIIFLAHLVGLFTGLFVAKQLEKDSSMPLFFVSLSMIIGSLVNIAMIPHPIWFSVIDPVGLFTIAFLFYRWKNKSVR